MVVPLKVVAAAIIYAVGSCAQASPSTTAPSNALGNPTAPAFAADGSSSTAGSAGVPLSSQISFRTKTRNGVRGAAFATCYALSRRIVLKLPLLPLLLLLRVRAGVCSPFVVCRYRPRQWQRRQSKSFPPPPLGELHT